MRWPQVPCAILFGICLLALLSGIATAARAAVDSGARAEKRVALVVGNGRYRQAPLANPENDARLIATRLRELGFEVREHLNLGMRDFRRTVRTFAREMQDTPGVVLFYFAGHGVQIDGRNYLLPIDVNLSNEDEVKDDSVDVDDLFVSQLESIRAQTRIVILDACRDNPFGGRTRGIRAAGGLAEMAARGTLIAYASAPGATAEDGPVGSNSVYTRHLAEEMMTPGLDVELMFKRVRVRVLQDTRDRQIPWVNTSLTTNFAFRERIGPDPAELARNDRLRKLEEELASTRTMLQQARERADEVEAARLAARATEAQAVAAATQAAAQTGATPATTTPARTGPSALPTPAGATPTTPATPAAPPTPPTLIASAPATMPRTAVSAASATSPIAPSIGPSPEAVAASAARDRAASDARREIDRLLEQLQVAEAAVAGARESSRIDAIRRASEPPPAPLVVAAPRARAPTKAERCADLLTRMSIGDAIGAESERFLHQECQ